MSRNIVVCISILAAVLFLMQPVASIDVSSEIPYANDQIPKLETDSAIIEEDLESEQSNMPLDDSTVIKNLNTNINKNFLEKMEDNRERMMKADPNVPIPEYDYDNIIAELGPGAEAPSGPKYNELELEETEGVKMVQFGPYLQVGSSGKTRAGGADLKITKMEWSSSVNSGWAHYTDSDSGNQPYLGGFMVGVPTKITVSVVNLNPTIPVSNVRMNFSIWDYYGGIPLIKIPTQVSFSLIGASAQVELDFTPPAAKVLYIAAYIDYPDDPVTSNNGLAMYGMQTIIWTADFEAEGNGDGSQSPNTWGGDLGTKNKWHKTDTAQNQNSQDHTTVNSYYHGTDDSPDYYNDFVDLYLISPKIDMGDISNGQEEAGILPEDYYYPFAVPKMAGMFTGNAETDTTFSDSDILWIYEYTDDNGFNWKSELNPKSYGGYVYNDWATQGGQTQPIWHPNVRWTSETTATYGWPLNMFVADGTGDVKHRNGAMNWSRVQFRLLFDGDAQNDTDNLPGYYGDDFITWGYQHWLPPYNIRISEVSNVKSMGVPILYPNVACSFDTSIVNMGEALTNVPVKIQIYDAPRDHSNAKSVHGPVTKTISSLKEDYEVKMDWTWTPSSEGDYYVYIEAGDLTQDYTPQLNIFELKLIVRKVGGRLLVVDDDNSLHSSGIFYVDVEERMLQSLDDIGITYNVYNVDTNESGPTKAIMNNFEAVIWLTGLDNEHSNYGRNPQDSWSSTGGKWGITLKPEDQSEIAAYLDEGDKNLWLISPGVLYDLTDSEDAEQPSGFLKDYLHVTYCNANETTYKSNGEIEIRGTPAKLLGVENSLAGGVEYDTYKLKPPAGFIDIGGLIDKDSNSVPIFYQNTAKSAYNSLEYSDNYNLVYFAFNYYLIADREDRRDLTYRVLKFFGMVGGVTAELEEGEEETREIKFGDTLSFKFKVTNLGLLTEELNVKLVNPSPSKVPRGWSVKLNDRTPSDPFNKIVVAGLDTRVIYLNVTVPLSYLDSSGNLDTTLQNITAGSEIQFKLRVESSSYPEKFFDFAGCIVIMEKTGHIELLSSSSDNTIDFSKNSDPSECFIEHKIRLRYITNDDEDTEVLLQLANPSDLDAEIYRGLKVVTNDIVSIEPRVSYDYTVHVSADEHKPEGEYKITFKALDSTGSNILNSTDLAVNVAQYYDIELVKLSSMSYTRVLDPNKMVSDVQTEEFEVTLENYGNGPDTITLDWVENRWSPNPIPLAWEDSLVEIYDKNGGSEEIDEITVPAYDMSKGVPGSVSLLVKINIPKEDEEGVFFIDLTAFSSAPKQYITNLQRSDFEFEDNTTFTIQLILPNIEFDEPKNKLLDSEGNEIKDTDIVHTGDTVNIKVNIDNTANIPTEDIEIKITITVDNKEKKIINDTVKINPDGTIELSYNYTPDEAGYYTFRVDIDPDNKIIGDRPNDNTWTTFLVVEDPPEEKGTEPENKFIGDTVSTIGMITIAIVLIIVIIIALFIIVTRKRRKKAESEMDPDSEELLMVYSPTEVLPPEGAGDGRKPIDAAAPEEKLRPDARRPFEKPIDIKAVAVPKVKPKLLKEGPVKNCPGCGGSNPVENKFCQGCGSKLLG